MPFDVPSFTIIRERMLRDYVNINHTANVASDSDFYVRASAVASAVDGLYTHQQWLVKQIFPDTADADFLELHARTRGLSIKPAVSASGYIKISGVVGTLVPEGTGFVTEDGREYVVTQDTAITEAGGALAPAAAVAPGDASNEKEGSILNSMSSIAGLNEAVIENMEGGTEKETHQELLTRLLEVIRRPAAGGNKYDYRRWAMEVPGVTNAYVYPLRRGLGTVDIVIMSGGLEPSKETINAVYAYIDERRPVTASDFIVMSPQIKTVDIDARVQYTGTDFAACQQAIKDRLLTYFSQLAPGQIVVQSKLSAIVADVDSIADSYINEPGANIQPSDIELCVLGNVSMARL